ncbi:hypothetical protein [Streptosporangium sp. G12]
MAVARARRTATTPKAAAAKTPKTETEAKPTDKNAAMSVSDVLAGRYRLTGR